MTPKFGKFQAKQRKPVEKIPTDFYLQCMGVDTWQNETPRYNVTYRDRRGNVITQVHDSRRSAYMEGKRQKWIVEKIKRIDWKD